MKSLLLLFFISLSGLGFAQGGFHKLYGGDHFDYGYDIVALPDSSFFVTGMTGSYTSGHAQAFLMRLDKFGDKQWILPYGGLESDAALDLEYKENFGTYLSGRTTSPLGDFDVWIALVDDLGAVQWERTYPAENWEEASVSAMTQYDGLLVGVHRFGAGTLDQDASLLRLNSQGDTVWVQEFSAPGKDEVTKIARFQDSLFVVASNHYNELEATDFSMLQMIHEDGTLIWKDTIGIYPGNSYLNDFYLEGDTLYGVGACKLDNASTFNRMRHLHRLSLAENGDLLTNQSSSAGNMIEDVVTNVHGFDFIYSSFRFQDPAGGSPNYDFFLGLNNLQLTPIGLAGNTNSYGEDRLYEAIPTLDSGAVFVGTQSLPTGGSAVVILKIGKDFGYPVIQENPTVTPIAGVNEPSRLSVFSLYPNPTKETVNMQLEGVRVDAFVLSSPEGKVLKSGLLDKDNMHSINVAGLNSGVYLVTVFMRGNAMGVQRLIID